ncbi:hypothetical protein Ahy_B04g069390 [Arachis hypogaea]|uniref:Ubiquitin-like protease family profile domain-containing protein n=1 Tax=Arachis hypogaea TaxID=3818 RepID=A0A444ZCF9_ARAHY|nr:hypothetical protein Ahy_B04g069390 [Arachis hypogaea]
MESKKRKKIQEDSDSETESNDEIPEVNLGSDDPLSQGHTDQSSINKLADSMLSLVEESANDPAEENMMVVRVETQSQTEALSIVPIQVYLPLFQTTPVPEIEPTPAKSPSKKINEETTKSTPEPQPKPEESTPTLPPAPSKINLAPEDVAALMMMARTASYIPKEGLMPSFSLGLTDSSQEEGERAKTPETPKLIEQLGELVEKFASSGATHVKTYGDRGTNEYDAVYTLNAQDRYILSKVHFASLKANTHIEAEIVSTMCLILNQQNIKRFQEEIYCLSPDIVNMAVGNHPNGKFLQPKTNKPFRVEDYPIFIPFLDLKKLASHPYIFASVCYSNHWCLWVADARKKIYILDPYHKTCPSDTGMNLNKFIYMLGAPLKRKDQEIEPPYINISGQKTSYDYVIYVMKWLEIIQPKNVKRWRYEWDNWTQDEVDHYRVEYASRILFHEMNQDKAEAIRGSDAIRLSKPSSLLLSPYNQIDSNDIDTD